MAVEIKLPRLGRSMQKPVLVEWMAKEGERVEQGSSVLVIETEKIRSDIEATASGFLHILIEAGNEAEVSSVVGLIAETQAELETLQKELPLGKPAMVAGAEETPLKETAPVKAALPTGAKARDGERIQISPVARKLAEGHMIDITRITGTGPGGRIVRDDVEKAIQAETAAPVTAPSAGTYEGKRVKEVISLAGMKGAIAEHMHRSLAISAQVTVMGELDMLQTVKLRKELVAQESVLGTKITYTSMFVLAAARALKENPTINSSIIDNEIKVWEDINIGVAIALEKGLIVPVVKNADQKSLVEIDRVIKNLTEKARNGKLMPDDMADGTFTVSNIGAVGVGYRFSTVIINQPQSAILGMGSITDRAQVRDGQIVIRPIMTYSFTYDHRATNGAAAASFMAAVSQLLEKPESLMA